jgi:hypothetical protein
MAFATGGRNGFGFPTADAGVRLDAPAIGRDAFSLPQRDAAARRDTMTTTLAGRDAGAARDTLLFFRRD